MENRTVSLWINQSETRSRTVSLWINQSDNEPCQRVRKRDKPAKEENRRRTVSIRGEIFCLTMMCFSKKFRKSQSIYSRKSRKMSLQSKRISKKRRSRCCIVERRESIQRRKKFYKSHQIVLLFRVLVF